VYFTFLRPSFVLYFGNGANKRSVLHAGVDQDDLVGYTLGRMGENEVPRPLMVQLHKQEWLQDLAVN